MKVQKVSYIFGFTLVTNLAGIIEINFSWPLCMQSPVSRNRATSSDILLVVNCAIFMHCRNDQLNVLWLNRSHGGSPAFLLYSQMSICCPAQSGFVSAKYLYESRSRIMAEYTGRSLKFHMQQYFIKSYLQDKTENVSLNVVLTGFLYIL